MSDLRRPARVRRLRSDAVRSRDALVDAAVRVIAEKPDAGLAQVAAAAGLTRQTLYAHFGSRERLLAAVLARITADAVARMEAARLDEGPAVEALGQFLAATEEISQARLRVAVIAAEGQTAAESERAHAPVAEKLAEIVRRGQRTGEFDDALPVGWLVSATIALGHAAYDARSRGELDAEAARTTLRRSVLRLCGVRDR